MKLKKGVKRFLIAVVIILVAVLAFFLFKNLDSNQETKEVKVVSKISEYGYTLKDSKTKAKREDLNKILDNKYVSPDLQEKLDEAVEYFNLAIDANDNYDKAYEGRNQAMLENHLKIIDLQESLKKYF